MMHIWQKEDWAIMIEANWHTAVFAARRAVALFGPDVEACGYIIRLKDWSRQFVVVCRNIRKEPGMFALADEDCMSVYDAMERGTLGGVWHSHPKGHHEPSFLDWEAHPRGTPMFIVVLEESRSIVVKYEDAVRPTIEPYMGSIVYEEIKGANS